jgi:imidazolonepropionase-like amidohydrolase
LIIKAGTLIDGTGTGAVNSKAIIIRDNSIESIADWSDIDSAAGDQTIDLSNHTVLPGLIDCHVHPTFNGEPNYLELAYTKSGPYRTLMGQKNVTRDLMAGFTTVRALGERSHADIALRDGIRDRLFLGPRIVACGQAISVTGGHGDLWLAPGFHFEEGLSGIVVDGVDEFRKAARIQLKYGADVVKLLLSGGFISVGGESGMRYMTAEEIRAAAEEAHLWGKKLSAHSHGDESSRVAIENGVDTLEHGTFMGKDPAVIDLMVEKGTFWVPTLSITSAPPEHRDRLPEFFLRKQGEAQEYSLKTFEIALKAGVRIAAGSDTGAPGVYHGQNARELELMVRAGMSEMDVIVAATRVASECCDLSDQIGTIESGKLADIIAVEGDPLSDITALKKVGFVMKEGEVVKDSSSMRTAHGGERN